MENSVTVCLFILSLSVCMLKTIMSWKVLSSMVAVASIASLLHCETETDVLYVQKEVVLPVTRAKAFLFIADMSNYRRVRCSVFYDDLYYYYYYYY